MSTRGRRARHAAIAQGAGGVGDASAPPRPSVFGALRTAASDMLARAGIAAKAGVTFGGLRNLWNILGYKVTLAPEDFRARYDRDCIAGRIVDAMPKATWRGGGEVVDDEDPEVETPFEEAWRRIDERLKLWPLFERADILAGLGRYSVILIGAPGPLDQPLDRAAEAQVLYLQPFAEKDAAIKETESHTDSPRFGQPTFYELTIVTGATGQTQRKRVHHSRVLHIADGLLDSNVHGRPRLERPWNRLDDLDKVTGGGAEAFWLRANQGTQIDLDPALDMGPEDEQALNDEVEEYQHGIRRMLRTRGVKVKPLGSDVASFKDPAEAILQQISAGSEIPMRVLTGSERGELASTQDKSNWNERVQDRRLQFAEASVVRPFVDRLITLGALPVPRDERYQVRWPDLSDMDDTDRMDLAVKASQLNAHETVITPDEIRDRYLQLAPLAEVLPDEHAQDATPTDTPDPADPAQDPSADDPAAPPDSTGSGGARAADSTPWRAIHRAAATHERRVRRVVLEMFADARDSVSLAVLENAVRDNAQRDAVDHVLGVVEDAMDGARPSLERRLLDTFVAGARAANLSTTRASMRAADVGIVFDAGNPAAEEWAAQHAASLIKDLSGPTREAVRTIIRRAFSEGFPPSVAARQIRQLVGLTPTQAEAVLGFQARLAAAAPGSAVEAGTLRVRVPASGLTEARVRSLASQYAGRLQQQRALTIARTETLRAANEGQHALWREATSRGLLAGREEREWIYTPDESACPLCTQMDGQRRALNEPFEAPDGRKVMTPPLHPSCRCAMGLSAPKKERHAA